MKIEKQNEDSKVNIQTSLIKL